MVVRIDGQVVAKLDHKALVVLWSGWGMVPTKLPKVAVKEASGKPIWFMHQGIWMYARLSAS